MLAALVLAGAAWFDGFSSANAQFSMVLTNASRPLPRRASIILIVANGLGYGDLSCYGQTKYQTPNLDRLAAGGIRFTSYYAGDAASSPARAALMLGRDPRHLKQRADVDVPLAADDVTVAQVLRQSGYSTGLIGEWDLGDDQTTGKPWNHGFDQFAGYFEGDAAENFYADYLWRYDGHTGFQGRANVYQNMDGKKNQYIPDLLTTIALNFISNDRPDRFNQYRPFFLQLNCIIPDGGTGLVPTDAPFSEEPWPQVEKNRAAMITRLDESIGRLVSHLKQLNLVSNTVIFFTSDTGSQTNGGIDPKFFRSAGSFRSAPGELYEGDLRVPMIASWPGRIAAGQVSDFTWAAWDLMPTLTDIALVGPSAGTDGLSVFPVLLGQTPAHRHEFFHWRRVGRNVWHTIRQEDWEAVQPRAGAPLELYNLKTDPGETKNVADQHHDIVGRFQEILKDNP